MPGPYRTRTDEILALRKRTPRYRVPFPDLSVDRAVALCTNAFGDGRTPARKQPEGMKQFPVGHQHKQGGEMITPGMMKHLEFMGGKKP